jgi:hypothetical protein
MDVVTLGAAKADTKKTAAGLRRNSASIFRGMIPIARRAVNLGTGNQSNGTDTSGMYRRCHPIMVDASEIRLVYSNYYGANAALIADGPNDITVQAAVELPVNAVTFTQQQSFPVTVGGLKTFTIPAGGQVVSDPIPYTGKAGQFMYVQTYVSVASAGMKWPTSFSALGSGTVANMWEGGTTGAPTTNLVGGTSNGPVGNVGTYGPSAIIGTPAAGVALPKVGYFFGDSIQYGSSDYTSQWEGWSGRAAAAQGVPYVNVSHPGEQVAQVQGIYARHRLPYAVGADFAITNYGRNDLANIAGISLATFQANLIAWWTQLAFRGLRVYQTTITPKATSTDTWMTVANQSADTANSYETNRVAANTWLRDGAPISAGAAVATGTSGALRMGAVGHPLTGIIEIADLVETVRNSGKFKVGRVVTDAAYTSGTRTVTSATAAFTSADLGAALTIGGAGAAGATLVNARISSVESATQVTYDAIGSSTVSQTASGQTMQIGGWTWDGTHPTPNAHAAIAAAVDLTSL